MIKVNMIYSHNNSQRAFTLIELLVVISIIGVLSSVVLVAVQSARDKGVVGAAQTFDGHTYAALYDDLVAAWDFDGDSGSIAKDKSGNGNDLSLKTTPTPLASFQTTPNPFSNGQTLYLQPGGDATTPSATAPLLKYQGSAGITDFSVSMWVRFNSSNTWNVALISDLASLTINTVPAGNGEWRINYQNGNFNFSYKDNIAVRTIVFPAPIPDKWYQIVATCSSNNNKLGTYINGKFNLSTSFTSPCSFLNSSNGSVKIARAGGTDTFYLDNVRIYKKALPVSVIQDIYLAESQKYENLAKNNK